MRVACLALFTDRLMCGYAGGPPALDLECKLDFTNLDLLDLQSKLSQAVKSLLVPPNFINLVLAEPTLFNLRSKTQIVGILFALGVSKIGFINQSVCQIAGETRADGVIFDTFESVYVPVIDYRELTPFISSDLKELESKVGVDLRKPLRQSFDLSYEKIWLGLNGLCLRGEVWPLLTASKFAKHGVWDALYDVK